LINKQDPETKRPRPSYFQGNILP